MFIILIFLVVALLCVTAIAAGQRLRLRALEDELFREGKRYMALLSENRNLGIEIRKLKADISRLKFQATSDPLTGLPNRRAFETALERDQARANHSGKTVVFFVFDLEDFKAINDGLGHRKGDEVLCAFAKVLRSLFRREDNICRAGGDEAFATIIFDGFDIEILTRKRDLLRAVIWNGTQAETGLAISASVGFGRTLQEADAHMYLDKHRGGYTVTR
jgi:diguanylate cyclase (GGDEF)-like protein